MKKKEKGFMLVETLVVSTLVSTILVILYVQFNTIVKNFNKDFHYNSVNNLYATQNIKKFILNDDNGNFYTNLKNLLNQSIANDSNYYLTIVTDCSGNGTNSYQTNNCSAFTALTEFYQVKNILFTMDYIDLKDSDYDELSNPNLESFIKSIKNVSSANVDEDNKVVLYDYRIIIEFNNYEYATLKIAN